MDLSNIHFASPVFLLLFLLVPAWFYYERKISKKGILFRHGENIGKSFWSGSWYVYLPMFIRFLILSTFILLFSDPRLSREYVESTPPGIDIVITLDISKSMLAEDMKPNRMEIAKKTIWEFVQRQKNDRLWLVIFAGKPFVSIPLTFDYTVIKDSVDKLTTDSIEQTIPGLSGTAIGDWLLLATDLLTGEKEANHREKVIILLTDGEANVWVNPRQTVKLTAEKWVKIFTIGIGDPKGTELYVTDPFGNKRYFQDDTGKPVIAKLDEEMLKYIADTTGGSYYNATDSESFKRIFQELETLTKRPVQITAKKIEYPVYEPFIWSLLLLLILELYLRTKWRVYE